MWYEGRPCGSFIGRRPWILPGQEALLGGPGIADLFPHRMAVRAPQASPPDTLDARVTTWQEGWFAGGT